MSLTSCDEPDNTSSDIVGIWRITHDSGYEKENGRIVDSWSHDYEYDESLVFHFKENGELISYEYDGEFHEIYGFLKIDGNKLYLHYYDEDLEFEIKTLTSNRLVISIHEKDGIYEYYEETTFRKEK